MTQKNTFLVLLGITIFGGFLRLFLLDRIPNAIGGDELNYILVAKSIWLYGTDITRSWNPFSIFAFQYPPGPSQAEIPYLLQVPIVGPLPFSLFNARVLPAVLSILSIPLLFLISKKLFNIQAGLIAAFFFAINPWTIYISRTTYENAFAMFFFLSAWSILFYFRSWKLLFSIPLFYAAFYSYIGTKLIFLPFVFILLWYSYKYISQGKFKKYYFSIFATCTILVLFFTLTLFSGTGENRTGEILLPTSSDLSIQVDTLRRNSITNPITPFFENKPVLFLRILSEKFYKTFSFDFLFFQGDMFFTVGRHGLFYVTDLLFLISGIWFMIRKQKRELILLTSLILLSTLPQLFHTAKIDNFSFHLILLYPLLLIIMAYGAFQILTKFRFKYKYILFLGAYLFLLLNFLQVYFFQTPLQGHFDFNLRPLSRYISLSSKQNEVKLFTPSEISVIQKYMFYSNSLSPKNLTTQNCPEENMPLPKDYTVIVDSFCEFSFDAPNISLAQLKDGGETYRLYNDTICKGIELKTYPSNIKLSDFLIEEMSSKEFCKTFVVKQ